MLIQLIHHNYLPVLLIPLKLKQEIMKNRNKAVVWLDHSNARLATNETNGIIIIEIHSPNDGRVRIRGESGDGTQLGNYRSSNNESHHHNQEIGDTRAFYKHLSELLIPYEEIHITGPTKAHDELFNFLKKEKQFQTKQLTKSSLDYLTENQLESFVKKQFSEL